MEEHQKHHCLSALSLVDKQDPFLIGNNNSAGSTTLLLSSGSFESLPSLVKLLGDLSVGKTLIDELIFEHDELELNMALAIMLEDVSVGLLGDGAGAEAAGRVGDLPGPRFDGEIVGLDVAIRPRPPRSL